MNIAVIGDYESPQYKDLLQRVKMAKPDEDVIDLSAHNCSTWNKNRIARFEDIFSAHLVIVGYGWRYNIDAKRDIAHAQSLNRECLIDIDGQFRPFPEYAREI